MQQSSQHVAEARLINKIPLSYPSPVQLLLNDVPEKREFTLEAKTQDDNEPYLDQVQVDPDEQLTGDQRTAFKELCKEFVDVITAAPGRYNGCFGIVSNAINFAEKPPPVHKVYQPKLTDAMKQVMAKKMDKLYEWGCLAYPEEIGVQVEFVSPSMLVPKTDPGEYRLVTDFTALNRYIKKFPATTPTINQAKKAIAQAKYQVHLDFSNWFYQSGMSRTDCQFLGVLHPYKGLMTYVVEPQGLRNASEHSGEKIARFLGDMIQDKRAVSMADGVHILAQSVPELLTNLREVFTRARQAGLTFKPSKILKIMAELEGTAQQLV